MELNTEGVSLKCTPTERAAIEALCELEERSISDMIRWLIRRETRARGLPLEMRPSVQFERVNNR